MRGVMMAAAILVLGWAVACRAEEDQAAAAAKLYDLVFAAEPATVARGEAGRIVVRIVTKNGGEVHKEPPVSLKLSASEHVTLPGTELTKADLKLVGTGAELSAPFTAARSGKGSVRADLVFYICTARSCTRQERRGAADIVVK